MKVWDDNLRKYVDSTAQQTLKQVGAYYPWNEALAEKEKEKDDTPYNEPVKEKAEQAAMFEYSIEIACAQAELNTYQVGEFLLQTTEQEASCLSWKDSQTQKDFTLRTVSVNVNEPKTLVREFFASSGGALIFKGVKPVNAGSTTHEESFIPVKPAVQVGGLLGWPTEGYFYHFIDDALTREYKLLGEGKWAFQATLSDADKLSDELLSHHTYSFILLPWKINRSTVARQHLLFLPQKMTSAQFSGLTPAWLDENACLLDVDSIVKTKEDKNIPREEEPDGQSNQLGDAQTNGSSHTVKINTDTGVHETWADIAAQHGLAPRALLNLNPRFEQDPLSLQVGDVLFVSQEKDQTVATKQDLLPPQTIEGVGQAIRFANAYASQVKDRQLRHNVVAVLQDSTIPQSAPIIIIHKECPGCEDQWVHLKGTIKEWLNQSNSDKPKIIMTGDGHRTPPFAYAEGNEFIKKQAQRNQLFLYVEETQDKVDANLNDFVPKTMRKGFIARGPTKVIGWEPQISQLMKQTFEDVIESLNIGQQDRQSIFNGLLERNSRILDALLEENESLAMAFNTASNKHLASIAPGHQNFIESEVDTAARDIMKIVSGEWRDNYINPVIGKKIAKDIMDNPKATFLISIGDCHLDENPIQKHISRALGDNRRQLPHDFVIDHSRGLDGTQ